MDKLFDFFYDSIEKNDYSKAMEFGLMLLILFVPSISIIFVYKRNLFMSLDIGKLLLIGVVCNVILFIIIYVILKLFNNLDFTIDYYKYRALGEKIKELKQNKLVINNNEIKEEFDDVLESYKALPNPIKKHNIKIINEAKECITILCILIWGLYIFDYIFNINMSYDFKFKRLIVYNALFIIIYSINKSLNIKKYIKNIKNDYKTIEKKEYKKRNDKTLILAIISYMSSIIFMLYIIYGCFKG